MTSHTQRLRRALLALAAAAVSGCGPRPYRTVPLPITPDKLPVRVDITLDSARTLATVAGETSVDKIENVIGLSGDVRALRGDTLVVEYRAVGYASRIVLAADGVALVPLARVKSMQARHIPSPSEQRAWDRKAGFWAIVLSIGLIAASLLLSAWLQNLAN